MAVCVLDECETPDTCGTSYCKAWLKARTEGVIGMRGAARGAVADEYDASGLPKEAA